MDRVFMNSDTGEITVNGHMINRVTGVRIKGEPNQPCTVLISFDAEVIFTGEASVWYAPGMPD